MSINGIDIILKVVKNYLSLPPLHICSSTKVFIYNIEKYRFKKKKKKDAIATFSPPRRISQTTLCRAQYYWFSHSPWRVRQQGHNGKKCHLAIGSWTWVYLPVFQLKIVKQGFDQVNSIQFQTGSKYSAYRIFSLFQNK